MDLNLMKQKFDSLKNESTKSEKKDFKKNYWVPPIGEKQIRVLPSKFNSSNPFTDVKVYYGIGNKTKVMISPLNFGEKDPINEFVKKLNSMEYTKENYWLSKKLEPKVRTSVPVIVRGEEDKGVRLWEFGKTVYESLLGYATDEDYGDFTDIVEGFDFTVTTVGPETTGTKFNESKIRPKRKNSPLSKDKAEVKLWLEEQPDPFEKYKRYSYDQMKASLAEYLSPEDEEEESQEGDIIDQDNDNFDDEKETGNFSMNTSKDRVKKNKEDQFNDLFDKDTKDDSSEEDGLPF